MRQIIYFSLLFLAAGCEDEMALNKQEDSSLDGRREEASADYPYGTIKDRDPDGQGGTVPDTGTPTRAIERVDIDGFLQALLKLGNITPSESPDTALNSQYLKGLLNQVDSLIRVWPSGYDPDTPDSNLKRTEINENGVAVVGPKGSVYQVFTALADTGIQFSSLQGNGPGSDVNLRWSEFPIDPADYALYSGSFSAGGTRYANQIVFSVGGIEFGVPLEGIPNNTDTHDATVRIKYAVGAQKRTLDVSGVVSFSREAAGQQWLTAIEAEWVSALDVTAITIESVALLVGYDPTFID